MSLSLRGRQGTSGQAAVETALTLPLTLFMIMGCMQLFMLMQAKVMAQYAIYQAARMGSVSNGRCDIMLETAVLTFSPAIRSLMSPNVAGASPGLKLASVFAEFKSNDYGPSYGSESISWNGDTIVWIMRESPTPSVLAREQWDWPIGPGANPQRLELKAVFWAPLRIPFADWVFSRMELAHLGIKSFDGANPLSPTQRQWTVSNNAGNWAKPDPSGTIAAEYANRLAAKHYQFPIQVSYTMRMMSPVMQSDFAQQQCPGTPGSL
jgi:hypothetical protein